MLQEKWYSAIKIRKSRRKFNGKPLEDQVKTKKYTLEEKILAGLASGHKHKPLTELCSGLPRKKWPGWIECGLEAARLAPSAVNRQPWRFQIEANSVTISVDSEKNTYNIPKRLDCGIAMLHFELGAYVHGIKGKWEFLNTPQVAKFIKI